MSTRGEKDAARGNPSPSQRSRDIPAEVPAAPGPGASVVVTPEDIRNRKRTLRVVAIAVAILIAIGIPAYGVWSLLIRPQSSVAAGLSVQVEIADGSDTKTIANLLAGTAVINNSSMFRLRARIEGVDGKLRPGVYEFETGMSIGSVIEVLLVGPGIEYTKVTIPEGFTVEQIAERLETDAGISAAEFSELALQKAAEFTVDFPFLKDVNTGSLEGYLFPKTYQIPENATPREVIEMMLAQFEKEFVTVDLSYAESKNLSPHDVVILASMIEREARVADERALVSSVIYNRLAKGMRLEIDATIEYILPGTRPRLLNRHLRIDSPYNTYMYDGLPVGPISSPGLASLEAAARPADTKYLYYVLTSTDGSHTFTTNLKEFLEAKEKSREVVP